MTASAAGQQEKCPIDHQIGDEASGHDGGDPGSPQGGRRQGDRFGQQVQQRHADHRSGAEAQHQMDLVGVTQSQRSAQPRRHAGGDTQDDQQDVAVKRGEEAVHAST